MSDGVSKAFISKLSHIGVGSLPELLLYLPTKYQDYRKPAPGIMSGMNTGEKIYLKLRLENPPIIDSGARPARVKLRLTDGMVSANAMVFGGAYAWGAFKGGDYVHVTCKVEEYNGWPSLKSLELLPMRDQSRIAPAYRGKEKVLSPNLVAENISILLRDNVEETVSFILSKLGATEEQIIKYAAPDFESLADVLRALHRPKSMEEVSLANDSVRRINAYQALMLSLGADGRPASDRSIIHYTVDDIKNNLKGIPFNLTKDQKRAIWDITKDLNEPIPMDRLVSGDVGCGKTVSYSVPAVCSHLAGKRVVVMMPNTLLAKQVADEIESSFPNANVELLVGGAKRKKGPFEGNPIIVGTTAILWWMKTLERKHEIDLLIIDEQQKLGGKQRAALISKHTNILEATATAIPRTTALMKYGTKSVSYIEECPVDKTIDPIVVGAERKKEVFDELVSIVKEGYQVAILYPIRKRESGFYQVTLENHDDASAVIQELQAMSAELVVSLQQDEDTVIRFKSSGPVHRKVKRWNKSMDNVSNLEEVGDPDDESVCKKNVEEAAQNWEKLFPGQVVMLHGGLSTEEKMAAINRAKSPECKIIITSSVIEVGLTMPSLRGLLVIDADKYGASTLHQFRGRLARHGGYGKFFMMVDRLLSEIEQKSLDRLNLLVKFKKGSQIAENDMLSRGFGDVSKSGTKQAGYVEGIFPGMKMTPQDIDFLMKKMA